MLRRKKKKKNKKILVIQAGAAGVAPALLEYRAK